MSPSAAAIIIEDESSNDALSVASVDVKELMDSWTSCYGTPKSKKKEACCLDTSTTPLEASLEGSWRFDLGALEHETTKKPDTTRKSRNSSGGLPFMPRSALVNNNDDDDDDDSENSDGLFSQMEEATLAMQTITRRTFEHSQSTAMETSKSSFETSKSSFENSFLSKDDFTVDDDLKEDSLLFENCFATTNTTTTTTKTANSSSVESSSQKVVVVVEPADTTTITTTNNNPELEQRRAARAARMEKVRQRIAREKEDAKAKKEEKERRAKQDDLSDDARRKNAYEWYCRLGMIPKKEMKRRIKLLGTDAHVSEADCDLLPWTFNGSMVNTTKLNKLSKK